MARFSQVNQPLVFLGVELDNVAFSYSPNGKHEFFQRQKLELKKKRIFYQDL